jgi:hypothetical protein
LKKLSKAGESQITPSQIQTDSDHLSPAAIPAPPP